MNLSILSSLGITEDLQGIMAGQDGPLNTSDVDKQDFSRMLLSHIKRIAQDPDTDIMTSNHAENRLTRIADVNVQNRENIDHLLSSEFQQLSEFEIAISQLLGEIAGFLRSYLANEGLGKMEPIVGSVSPHSDENIPLETAAKSNNEKANHNWQGFEISSDTVYKLASLISRFMDNESNNVVISGKDSRNETAEISDFSDGSPGKNNPAASIAPSRLEAGIQVPEGNEQLTRDKPEISPAIWINMASISKAQSFESGKTLSVQTPSQDGHSSSNPSDSDPGAIKVEKQPGDGSGQKKLIIPFRSGIWINFRSKESMSIGSDLSVVTNSHPSDLKDIQTNMKSSSSNMPQYTVPRGVSPASPVNQIISDEISAESNPQNGLERNGFMRLSIPLHRGDSLAEAPKLESEIARTISIFVSRSPVHISGLNNPEIATDGGSSYVSESDGQKETIKHSLSMQALPQDLIQQIEDWHFVEIKGGEIRYEHGSSGTIESDSKTSAHVKTDQTQVARIIFIPPATIEKLLGGSDQVDRLTDDLDPSKKIQRITQSIDDSDSRWQPQPNRELTDSRSGSIDLALRTPNEKDLSRLSPITAGFVEKVLRKNPDSTLAHSPRVVESSEESVEKANFRASTATQEQEVEQIKSNIFVSQESNDREQPFEGGESRPISRTGSGIDRNQSISFSNNGFKASIDNNPNNIMQTAVGGADSPVRIKDIKIAIDQIVRTAKVQIGQSSSQIEVKLKPEYLGMLRIVVKSTEKEVKAVLYIERPEVRQAIEGQIQQLFRSAQEQSIRLDKVEVQEFSTTANSGNQMSSQNSEGEKGKIHHELTEGNVDSSGPLSQQSQSKVMQTHRNFGYNSLELVI